jgi:hypothetical protein
LRNRVCVTAFWRFKDTHHLYLQDYKSLNLQINLRMKAVSLFETKDSNYPTTRRNNPADLLPQQNVVVPQMTVSYSWEYPSLWLFILPHSLCFVDARLIFYGRMKRWKLLYYLDVTSMNSWQYYFQKLKGKDNIVQH